MDIKDFEYRFNLASTHTAKDIQDWCDIMSSGEEKPIEKENTISLYDFLSTFNNVYNNFKKDLSLLLEYHLGKSISLVCQEEKYEDTKLKEFLMIEIDEPDKSLVEDEYTFLQVWVKDNEYESYVTNHINPLDRNHYFKKVDIDKNVLRKYLDFFKKYSSFIDTWKRIKFSSIFSNGTSTIFLGTEGDIMKELNKVTLLFGHCFLNSSEDFEIPILLGNNITIDYDNSIIRSSELEESNKVEIINHLLENIYVHRKDLSTLYENKEEGIISSNENIMSQKAPDGYPRILKK